MVFIKLVEEFDGRAKLATMEMGLKENGEC